MANDVTKNPLILDTTGVITTDRLNIDKIRWVGASSGAIAALTTGTPTRAVWASVARANNFVTVSDVKERVTGLTYDPTGSVGKLYIYTNDSIRGV